MLNNQKNNEAIHDAVSDLKEDFQELGKIGQKVASESYEHVKKNLGNYYNKTQEKVMEYEGKARDSIKANPFVALAVAAGIGFLAGWLRKRVM